MKKILSIALVLVLVLSLGATAFANGEVAEPTPTPTTYTDASTAQFTVTYTATNGTQPEEVFTFTEFTCTSVTDAASGVTTANAPKPEKIADITLNSTTTSGTATITLPTYTSVGVYTYTFSQNVGTTAGVTYYKGDTVQNMSLVVTVIEQAGKVRVAAVHVEAGTTTADKTGTIANTFNSGTLTVSKTVTGSLGDKTKPFNITVTLMAPAGRTVKDATYAVAGGTAQAITFTNGVAEIEFALTDSQSTVFTNLPKGVTWTVEEDDYTGEGYAAAAYSAASGDIEGGDNDTCTITNDKDVTPDTGISLDSLPYILIVAVVLGAAVVMVVNKRRSEV